ncbi:MAG: formate dehydrogenase accessory protein FdhE [Candidatus Syntrophonatronum acetioxidans]|uniref:Formate dehydrogenase accessory protein FdhE n=1 Tax=Candidatus Syntrophonatronum acetioxidans TaxID=1795816 RepID=A0A424YFD4_9FIRM|nr:MAG: formate dehydrogenase accessory protein FdhE [Candidatus Syntrophonatronum acetioxidans]
MNISRRNFLKLSCLAVMAGPLAAKLGCKVREESPDSLAISKSKSPEMDNIEEEIDLQLERNSNLDQTFDLYKGIMAIQLTCMDKIQVSPPFSLEEIKDNFHKGQYLLSRSQLDFDPEIFAKTMASITQVMKEKDIKASQPLENLMKAQEFQGENLQEFVNSISSYDKSQLENYIQKTGMDRRTDLDKETISFLTFASASPFYRAYQEEVVKITDYSMWRLGFCPVCGQVATIAKHREEDGARILECWLCYAQWYHPRMECPYCDNKDQDKLRFFYVAGDNSRQVHVCEECKKYLKVIDGRTTERETPLEVEDIATNYLDVLAAREGYTQPAINGSIFY